jgi:hypothetical protein
MIPLPQLMPVAKVVQQARLHPAQILPQLTHQSCPVPMRGSRGGLQLVFFYCHAEIVEPRDGLKLWPPAYVAYLDAVTGKFEELKSVTPEDFGQKHPPDKVMGKYLTVPQRLDAAFLDKEVKWFQAYDVILPCFAARQFGLPEQVQAAKEFARLMPEILETPLMPYYKVVADEFFAWVQRVGAPPA